MPAKQRDFIFEIGADFARAIYLAPGPDADIRGFTARMQIRPSADSDEVVLDLTTENGRLAVDYGRLVLNVPHGTTIDLTKLSREGSVNEPAGDGLLPFSARGKLGAYDLEIISPNGFVTRLLQGEVCFSKNVTR